MNKNKVDLGTFQRHTSNSKSHLYWMATPKKELTSTYFLYDTLKWNGSVDLSIVHMLDKKPYRINSTFYEKNFINPNTGEERVWINGINLCTFYSLMGVYPYPIDVAKKIEKRDVETDYKWDNTNMDISVHNFIMEGSKMHLIDFSDGNVRDYSLDSDSKQLKYVSDMINRMRGLF